jgi:2-haloacid dehalogenase
MQVQGLLFDAYGTLFDVHSVMEAGRAVTADPQALSALWRQKQLEYAWLRSLMGRYEDFWAVTESALIFACRRLGLEVSAPARRRLMDAYLALDAFPEVREALVRLRDLPCAILSNGSPRMLEAVVAYSGLGEHLRAVISVDQVRTFKPHPAVYALGPARLGLARDTIGFVSSNAWDVAGAKAFGFPVVWVNRLAAPLDELGVRPDLEVRDLGSSPRRSGAEGGGPLLASLASAGGLHRFAETPAEALLAPRVPPHVVAGALPESGAVLIHQLEPRDPLRAFPEVEAGDDEAHRAAVLGRQGAAVVVRGEHDVVVEERLERQVGRVVRLGVDHHVAGLRAGPRLGQEVARPDSAPPVVEPAPASHAVDI